MAWVGSSLPYGPRQVPLRLLGIQVRGTGMENVGGAGLL